MRDEQMSGRRPGWVNGELFPFTSRFVELDGHLVHYVDEVQGPTLLMLHGSPTWCFVCRDMDSIRRWWPARYAPVSRHGSEARP